MGQTLIFRLSRTLKFYCKTKHFAKTEASRRDEASEEHRQVPVVLARDNCTIEEYIDAKIKDEILNCKTRCHIIMYTCI